jgi:hypothetical protein
MARFATGCRATDYEEVGSTSVARDKADRPFDRASPLEPSGQRLQNASKFGFAVCDPGFEPSLFLSSKSEAILPSAKYKGA